MRSLRILRWFSYLATICAVTPLGAIEVQNVIVYHEPGRFGGWPANHGMWNWGNELLVGFSAGYYKDNGPERHAIDHDRPEEHLLARSSRRRADLARRESGGTGGPDSAWRRRCTAPNCRGSSIAPGSIAPAASTSRIPISP